MQGGDGLLVAGDAGTRLGRQAAIVGEVVGQVGELDVAGERVGSEAGDVDVIGGGSWPDLSFSTECYAKRAANRGGTWIRTR